MISATKRWSTAFCLLFFANLAWGQILPCEQNCTRYRFGIWIEKAGSIDEPNFSSISLIKRDAYSWKESSRILQLSSTIEGGLMVVQDDGSKVIWESPTKVVLIDKIGMRETFESEFPILFFETQYLSADSGVLNAYLKNRKVNDVLSISTLFLGDLVDMEFRKSQKRGGSIRGASSNVWIWTGEKDVPGGPIPGRNRKIPFDLVLSGDLKLLGWFDPANDDVTIQEGYEEFSTLKFWNDALISKPLYRVAKREEKAMVPMSDGISLASTVFLPGKPGVEDEEALEGPFPTILMRTPYDRKRFQDLFKYVSRGYAVVTQDTRGRYDSDGVFLPFVDEKSDGDETISWIAEQPWSDGKVGMIGASYGGMVQWHAAYRGNPHLKCLISQVTGGPGHVDSPYQNGSFTTGYLTWILLVGTTSEKFEAAKRKSLYDVAVALPLIDADNRAVGHEISFWREFLNHPTLDDFWKKGDIRRWGKNIDLPVLFVSGWYDDVLRGTIYYYDMMKSNHRENQHLILGPWRHGFNRTRKINKFVFGDNAIREDLNYVYVRWFDHWLKGVDNGVEEGPKAQFYTMGENEWKTAESWPPKNIKKEKWYFHSKGKAVHPEDGGWVGPKQPGRERPDHYVYDPANPTPFLCDVRYNEINPPEDYQEVERRKDTLVYTSELLGEALEISGDISAVIYAATDCRDTDWLVRLTDVFPDGQSIRLVDGLVKARFRKGAEQEELINPGKIYEYRIPMTWTSHRFLKGHRLRVSIASASAGLLVINTNTGNPIAEDTDYKIAHQTIHHDQKYPSHVILPVHRDGR
jgi:putative CocE/NonD family hydrolase